MPDLLQRRFAPRDGFPGHPLGNLLLAAMTELTGDFPGAIDMLSEMLSVRGRVLPATALAAMPARRPALPVVASTN